MSIVFDFKAIREARQTIGSADIIAEYAKPDEPVKLIGLPWDMYKEVAEEIRANSFDTYLP